MEKTIQVLMMNMVNFLYIYSLVSENDESKIKDYQDYIKKMKQMAFETKIIEENMRQFSNLVNNFVNNNQSL